MTEIATTGFWIFETNLTPALLLLSYVAKYNFDSSDLNAVLHGLNSSSSEKDIYFAYKLIGENTIDLHIARDEEGTDIILFKLSFDKTHSPEINLCISIVQDFDMRSRNFKV